jgi:hypothetical protein
MAEKPKRRPRVSCNVPECLQPVYHRGLCDEHWASRRDLADPEESP